MKSAVKTVVAGTAVLGIAACAGPAEAASSSGLAVCSEPVQVPDAVVKAHVLFNNQMEITSDNIFEVLRGIFEACACTVCGLGGFPWSLDPRTITQITLERTYLPAGQSSTVFFSDVSAPVG